METERWRRMEELFLQASELSPENRALFLDEQCGDDRELRRRVESMLSHDEEDLDEFSGPVSRAVAALRSVATTLGQQPRARIFHLLLLEKGDRVDPDELRENLSIVDDGSLFLIPVESPAKAGVLLREMFGRILP